MTKLPLWAREKIAWLERDVAYWKAKAAEFLETETHPETASVVIPAGFEGNQPDRGLPEGTRVRFYYAPTGDDRRVRCWAEARLTIDGKTVEIYAGDAVDVRPVASNRVDIVLRRG